ncbi:hypothetical protein X740_29710 [Mesorhizobium sp. LNHC221B00]|uniref:hypothetical protein n=1 Tax=Mesorhizobium sp. LNHC221B00 TaxID=1287233 RepID=UPI0003CDFC50|nr:hypothetical protein [Mesorhizobium sp. LNHC221B00]ESY76249.1 hypothetical protein X740_29710 [Mesorhizobium sp. LNHC221B00]
MANDKAGRARKILAARLADLAAVHGNDWPEIVNGLLDHNAGLLIAAGSIDPRFNEFARETIFNLRGVIESLEVCEQRAMEHFAEISPSERY